MRRNHESEENRRVGAVVAGILVGVATHADGDGSWPAAMESVTAGLVTVLTIALAVGLAWGQAGKLRAEIMACSPGEYEAWRSLLYPAANLGWLAVSVSRTSPKWAYLVTNALLLVGSLWLLVVTIRWSAMRQRITGGGLPPWLLSGLLVLYVALMPLVVSLWWLQPDLSEGVRRAILGGATVISLVYVVVALGGQFRHIWRSWVAHGVDERPLFRSLLRGVVIAGNFGAMIPSDGGFATIGLVTVIPQVVVESATLLLIRRIRGS